MRNGYFEYNEGKIYYELHGEGNKKTIVFIHGFSLDSRIWEPQIKEFQNTHQVLVYDMRGYRKSSLPKRVYSHHEDLKALLDFLHIQNTTLIGHSLGGEVAIDFALTYPSYVNRLVLISTSISGYFGNVNWDVSAQRQGIEKAKQNWLYHPVFKYSITKPRVKKILKSLIETYTGWHWVNIDPVEKPIPLAVKRLKEIKLPALSIVGEQDLTYYHDISRILEEKITTCKTVIIPDAGHMVNLEQSGVVNELIKEFL